MEVTQRLPAQWRSRAFASYSENPNLTQTTSQLLPVVTNEQAPQLLLSTVAPGGLISYR